MTVHNPLSRGSYGFGGPFFFVSSLKGFTGALESEGVFFFLTMDHERWTLDLEKRDFKWGTCS